MSVSLLIVSATRVIVGKGFSNDVSPGYEYVVVSDTEAAKLNVPLIASATVNALGVITVVTLPAPTSRDKTTSEMLADWQAAQDQLAQAVVVYNAAVDNYTAGRTTYNTQRAALQTASTLATALPAVRACFDAVDSEIQALASGLQQAQLAISAANTKIMVVTKALRMLPPDTVPV